jgi:SAM-dependent methyltransferase
MHPFADTFISEARRSEPDALYWLACDLCGSCGHIQTKCITNPEDRYSKHDYSYTSSNSPFSRAHWEAYAVEVSKQVGLSPGDFVVEIGSNDGYLLEQFSKQGQKVLGVDASPAMADLAKERGVKTIIGLFDRSIAERVEREHGVAQLVVANNVFNHADDVIGFANGVHDLLSTNGTFVFELPYWCIGIRDGRFDQIYHEHVSYFTVTAAMKIMQVCGMVVNRVEVVDYHGGSLRIFAKRKQDVQNGCEAAEKLIKEEREAGTFLPQTYREFMKRICERRNRFLQDLYCLKNAGTPIIGVGAAAKGNTFLNFYGLDANIIDYVTDSSRYKQGKYTPGTRIPIRGDEVLGEYGEVAALILSWNISETLKRILLGINPNIRFLVP